MFEEWQELDSRKNRSKNESVSRRLGPVLFSRWNIATAVLGIFWIACTVTGFFLIPPYVRHATRANPLPLDNFYLHIFNLRLNLIFAGVLVSVWSLESIFAATVNFLSSRWRAAYTGIALLIACGFFSWFIFYFGNRQFGAWDFSILIDSGWRQILGQKPYTDFISPNPPGFNLGIKYAFQVFGVNWNAQLFFTAIFASLSFLWFYRLFWKVLDTRVAAFGMAFAVECAVMLPLCFWWYNNTVSIVAALFFLSCLYYAKQQESLEAQLYYCVTLAILVLMKPNIAGSVSICGIAFLAVSIDCKRRMILLTLCAAATTFLILYLSHVSIPAMIASYRAVAIERGGFNGFGLIGMSRLGKIRLLLWTILVAAPIFSLFVPFWNQLQNRQWRTIPLYVFFCAVLLITCYGMTTDGEIKEVECGMLLAAEAVILFGLRLSRSYLRRFYIVVVFAVAVSGIYMGATRIRVFGIGSHQFFEWRDGDTPVGSRFFQNTDASPQMRNVVQQIKAAKSMNPGPFFFGPRMEFAYAVVGVPSPKHLPVYWQPGTSFARGDEPKLVEAWRAHSFKTLVFLKGDYTFYSPAFISAIEKGYWRDDSYADITVYHTRK